MIKFFLKFSEMSITLNEGETSMFTSITYLQSGNDKQQKVYEVMNKLNIMADLALYSPVLCGTIPFTLTWIL